MYSFNGIPVILSEYMTKHITKKEYRNERPDQRRGNNQSLRKLVYVKSFIVPSGNIMFVNGTTIIHPDIFYRIKSTVDKCR